VLGIFEDAEYCAGYCATSAQDLVVLFTDGLFEVEIAKANTTARSGCWPRCATGCAFPPENSSTRCSRKSRSAVCRANSRTTCVS
jgi:hypothetical protein